MTRLQKIDTIAIMIIAGFSFAILYHYILGTYMNLSYPYNTFLMNPCDKFMDFFNLAYTDPYSNGHLSLVQFPFGQRFAQLFYLLPSRISFGVFILIFLIFFIYVNYSNLKTSVKEQTIKNVFIFSFLTYPLLFVLDRANFEIYVFIFLYLFIVFYRKQQTIISIIFLSFAAAMKLFPAIFIVLLISDKKYKESIYAILLTMIISLCGYFSYDGRLFENINIHMTQLNDYTMQYAVHHKGLFFGHSLWGIIKLILLPLNLQYPTNLILRTYSIAVLTLFSFVSLYIIFIEDKFWKKIALLVFSMNLFPFVSGDYKLIHIFIPLFLFINSDHSDKFDFLYSILFGLLLIPKDYYHLDMSPEITSQTIINPLLMVFFMIVIIINGLIYWRRSPSKVLPERI